MRLWSLHPRYLDPAGLVALWRETLLARAVLRGATKGYRHHPQLARFQATRDPVATIDRYLMAVFADAQSRGYAFDASKFDVRRASQPLVVTEGQLDHEWRHLKRKLRARHPAGYRALLKLPAPDPHPLFRAVPGAMADWERP